MQVRLLPRGERRMSEWVKEYFCVACDGGMTFRTMMQSDGCCPMCGHITEGAVCKTVEKAVKPEPSRLYVAWTIWRLKMVKRLLAPILRWHIKRELKDRGQ